MSSQQQEQSDDAIPVIDMSMADQDVAEALLYAFKTIGFATLTNHGISTDTMDAAFQQSQAFFSLSTAKKLKYKYEGYKSNRGYIGIGCETHISTPDKKETFDMGNENNAEEFQNKWPTDELDESFKTVMMQYFDSFDGLYLRIMKLLAIGMKLDDVNYFVDRSNERHENLRLLHYPSVARPPYAQNSGNEPIVRGAEHTDFGTLTLLTQDGVGGLRAKKLDGTWVSITPVKHSVVVNVGDMLQRWSNDTLRATPHQVVDLCVAENEDLIPERFSIAFFCNANKNVMLDCLATCRTEASPPKYPPINAHEYLMKRLSETISKEASA